MLTINGGELDVSGDYYIAASRTSVSSSATLNMTNSEDVVRVGGSFLINTYINHKNYLTAGTMYISGDFTQIGRHTSYSNDESNYDYCAQEGHRTVLNGHSPQHVLFESSNSRFGTLKITQPLEMYVFNPDPCWITLIMPEAPVFGEPEFILPAALVTIDESAFEGTMATIIYIPDTCTSIGAYAFRNAAVIQIRIPTGCSIEDMKCGMIACARGLQGFYVLLDYRHSREQLAIVDQQFKIIHTTS